MSTGENPTAVFFDRLRHIGRIPMLAKVTGSLLVEIVDGRRSERVQITVKRGRVSVSPPEETADCALQADRQVWESLVCDRTQPMPAYLRGSMSISGDAAMLVLMRRLFAVAGVPDDAPTGQPVLAVAGRGRL
jgi:putative sterol carrier protein